MRIAFITPEYITEPSFDGGLAAYLHKMAAALKAQGHEPVIIVGSSKNEVLYRGGVKVIRVKVYRRFIGLCGRMFPAGIRAVFQYFIRWAFQSWRLNRALLRQHKSAPFDIVQYASYSATCYFRPADIPAMVRISSYQPLLLKEYGRDMSTLGMRAATWLENEALHKADAVYGPSRAIAAVASERAGVKVSVIEPPFLPPEITPDDSVHASRLRGTEYLLFFGTFGIVKGALEITDILPRLLSEHPAVVFAIAGKDSRIGASSAVESALGRAGHSDRVAYLGKLTRETLFPVIRHARLVVLPSRRDNLPNACIEAMSMGKVVIGTDGASFEELIVDGESGILCAPADPASLYSAIQRGLAMDDESRERMGEKARAVIERLRPENTLKPYLEFCRGAISRARGSDLKTR